MYPIPQHIQSQSLCWAFGLACLEQIPAFISHSVPAPLLCFDQLGLISSLVGPAHLEPLFIMVSASPPFKGSACLPRVCSIELLSIPESLAPDGRLS